MQYYASLSAEYLKIKGRQFHKLMKSGRINKVCNEFWG